ncbi:MAG: DNA mismatch repair protein [Polyangiales bacterium]
MKLGSRSARARIRRTELRPSSEARPSNKPPAPERSLQAAPETRQTHPDLLHEQASISVDEPALLHTLSFAFIAGSAGGSLQTALNRTALAASSFSPAALQDGLFIDDLIGLAFEFSSAGKPAPIERRRLLRLLTRPPAARGDIALRQAVLRELVDDPALEAALRRVYAAVAVLPNLLDEEGSDARLAINAWRIDLLRAIHEAINTLDASFAGASSALSRLAAFGEHVRASAGFKQLGELLDFEADSARADLQISLGADGRIRSLAIVSLRERSQSPFHVHPLLRLWRRLLAFVQGYTVGPTEIVDRWLETVWTGVLEYVPSLLQLKGDLEFYLGALHFRQLAAAKGLPVCLPELVTDAEPNVGKRVHGLWNPLLLGQATTPVTTQLTLPSFVNTCITTGPNSGGKTRFLQALGLCQLLGQAGAFVAASDASIRLVAGMFVSLGEAPHVDQKEGRLGMELTRIRSLFEQAQTGSLVILDELCSGTNPSEGEEIMRMLLELLHELEHEVHITTHFLRFAHNLQSDALTLGLSFLQVELDETEHPTYRFVPGVATTSLAHQTAERLGVTREQLRHLITHRDRKQS